MDSSCTTCVLCNKYVNDNKIIVAICGMCLDEKISLLEITNIQETQVQIRIGYNNNLGRCNFCGKIKKYAISVPVCLTHI